MQSTLAAAGWITGDLTELKIFKYVIDYKICLIFLLTLTSILEK